MERWDWLDQTLYYTGGAENETDAMPEEEMLESVKEDIRNCGLYRK